MTKFFYDTEFLEGKQKENFPISLFRKDTKPTIDLISIGMVSEDGREYYAVSKDFNIDEAWNRYDFKLEQVYGDLRNRYPNGKPVKTYWIRENVLKPIFKDLYKECDTLRNIMYGYVDVLWDENPRFCKGILKDLIKEHGKTNKQIAVEIKEFTKVIARDKFDNSYVTGEKVELYAYYGAYDHVALCWLFGKMIDLPDGFPMYTNDLKQELDRKEAHIDYIVKTDYQLSILNKAGKTYNSIKEYPNYPKQDNAHNALDDAIFNRNLYNFLKTL